MSPLAGKRVGLAVAMLFLVASSLDVPARGVPVLAAASVAPLTNQAADSVDTPSPPPVADPGSFIARCGASLCLHGQPFTLYGATMYRQFENLDWLIATAQDLHLNTIRVVNMFPQPYRGDPEVMIREEAAWQRADRAIAALATAGLHATLSLSDYRNYLLAAGRNPYTTDWGPFLDFVANRVNIVTGVRYGDDSTIALIALAGEVEAPTRSPRGVTTQQLTDFYARSLAEWRRLDDKHLISSGGLSYLNWNSGIDWQAIMALPLDDVCAIHVYSDGDLATTTPAVAEFCGALGKPWITEEFGVCRSTFYADTDRAARAQQVYTAQSQYHSAGILFWNLGPEVSDVTCDINAGFPLTYAVVRSNAQQ